METSGVSRVWYTTSRAKNYLRLPGFLVSRRDYREYCEINPFDDEQFLKIYLFSETKVSQIHKQSLQKLINIIYKYVYFTDNYKYNNMQRYLF